MTYPVRFDQSPGRATPRMTVPRPTVAYPIKFATPTRKPAQPAPAVSYPIDFSTPDGGQ
ncbi:hypothetical protein ACFVH9_16410 [Streptomyces hirsutus]|uniref:hypothetical protein n=1 Tax=Streptomyces hirsutus TaxID=35620 RepID=UPI00363FAD93